MVEEEWTFYQSTKPNLVLFNAIGFSALVLLWSLFMLGYLHRSFH